MRARVLDKQRRFLINMDGAILVVVNPHSPPTTSKAICLRRRSVNISKSPFRLPALLSFEVDVAAPELN